MMHASAQRLIVLLAVTAVPQNIFGQDPLEALRQQCEEARASRLTPLREAAIADCVSQRRSTRSREDCERIYQDFGELGATESGGIRPRLFDDLPQCLEYRRAADAQRDRRPSR
jgi:hypothetical protein